MHAALPFPVTPQAARALPLKLRRGMPAEQAFESILANCLTQIDANHQAVAHSDDVESLHQMRVGLRRLRAALAMFADYLVLPPALSDELSWLVGELGPARDWDVMLEVTLPALPLSPDVGTLARAGAQQMHARAGAAVASPRYGQWMAAMQAWRDRRGWRDMLSAARQASLQARVDEIAATILTKAHKRMVRRGRKLKQGGPAERHRLRIAAKRTRYASEFFASLFARRRVRPYVAALARLQDELGALNDADVASRLLTELPGNDGTLAADVHFARGYLYLRAEHAVPQVRRRWKKLRAMARPH